MQIVNRSKASKTHNKENLNNNRQFSSLNFPLKESLLSNVFRALPANNDLSSTCLQSSELAPSSVSEEELLIRSMNRVSLEFEEQDNSEDYLAIYGGGIRKQSLNLEPLGPFLAKHQIDVPLRARMLDWMTEVACSYKLEAKTYFDGIQYMDRYLKNKQRVVEAAELHALGVVAMFVATKAHEIFPLRIAVVCDKIGHRKISINKLCSVEADIIKTLDYQLNEWTFFDIASLSLSVFKDDFMLQILAYICRLVVIEYDFYNRLRPALIGEACAWLTLQILNKREPVWVSNKYEVMECGRMVLSLVSGFRSVHSGLKNADRFSDCAVVEKVFTYLETY